MGVLNILRLFLLNYYFTHKLKTLFAFLGISLGVALFVTTNLNGRRAEQSLIDFSTGYLHKNFSVRIYHNDSTIGISDDVVQKIYYNSQLIWIERIHPRFQRVLFLKKDNSVQKVIYQGIDIFQNRKDLSDAKFSKDGEFSLNHSYFSTSLINLIKENNFHLEYRDQILNFKSIIEIESNGGNYIIEDLSMAEERFGKISYNYLLIEGVTDSNKIENFKSILKQIDPGLNLETPAEISERAGSALKSYNLNLLIISMISVLIAFFMVSNTMTGIYISRRKELGILRSIGSTPLQNMLLFQLQAIILGLLGSGAGIILGVFFAGYRFFSGELTISDTSQAGSYRDIPEALIALAFFIGLFGSFFSALIPSINSYKLSPLSIIKDNINKNNNFNSGIFFILGILLIFLAYPLSLIKIQSPFPIFGLLSIGMIVIGETIQFPYLFGACVAMLRKVLFYLEKSFLGVRIGLEEIYQNPIKNTLTGGALMLAVSLVICLSQLTESYKKSILDWTDEEFPYSYSLVNIKDIQEGTDEGIGLNLREKVQNMEEVIESDVFILNNKVETERKIYLIHGYDMELSQKREMNIKGVSIYPTNFREGVFISSNMAFLGGKKIGENIELPTKTGRKKFPILGIREHFFSESGTIMIDEKLYEKEFRLENYKAIRVNFKQGSEIEGLKKLEFMIKDKKNLAIMSSLELKKLYLEGTEKVFSVLESLKITACIIALISLFSSILHSMSDKMKLFGVLKTLGASTTQLSSIIFAENFFLALFGSVAGILSALLLGPIILDVINKNAFGWTLKVVYPLDIMILFIFVSPIVALLGTIYPYLVLKGLSLREVLGYE